MNEAVYLRRPNFFPNKPSDYPLVLFMSSMIPAFYWFQIWVVLPALFTEYPVAYWTIFVVGHFCLHNVVGNFLAILIIDSSIRGREMPSEYEPLVQYCASCKTYTPPRSYHCPSCDICILKRDHHCMFTGCCVGFYNHRYFIFFVFYLMLSTIIFVPFNVYFLWDKISLSELSFLLIIFCPTMLFLMESGSSNIKAEHIYFFLSVLGIFGGAICCSWFCFHMKLILQGTIVHELKRNINTFNFGREKNLQLVFGTKWYLTWISPYIKSPLICDGIKYPFDDAKKK